MERDIQRICQKKVLATEGTENTEKEISGFLKPKTTRLTQDSHKIFYGFLVPLSNQRKVNV